jgi:hypothetical protein
MERPLRLNYSFAPGRIERLKATPAFQEIAASDKKPGKDRDAEIRAGRLIQEDILLLLSDMDGRRIYRNQDEFRKVLESAFKGLIIVPPYFCDVMMDALSEPDDAVETDSKGSPGTDPDLGG